MTKRPRPRLFALLWLVAGLGVVPMSLALLFVATDGIRCAIEHISGAPNYDYWDKNFALLMSLFGVICGFCVGILQQFIIARTWRLKLAGWWRATTVGGLLGSMLCWLLIEPLDLYHWLLSVNLTPSQYSVLHFSLPTLVLVVCLAAVQASWLRRHGSGAGSWLAAHALAILLLAFYGFFQTNLFSLHNSFTSTAWFLSHLVFLTVFTGVAMRRIVARDPWQHKAKRKNHAPDSA